MSHSPRGIYATGRGPLARLASPLAARARERRHERFFALTRLPPGASVLDVGCGRIGLRALEPELSITGMGDCATIVFRASASCSRGPATRTMSAPASATVRI